MKDLQREKVFGGVLGLAVGDALGVPVEFAGRAGLRADPVTGMREYGTHHQPAGTWSDDSSLAFCLAETLCLGGLDLEDLADRFVAWLYKGYWTPHGDVFDAGGTTRVAIGRLKSGVEPTKAGPDNEDNNGNGSLMRILPLAFYVESKEVGEQFRLAHEVSCLTHGHLRSQMACGIYTHFLVNLLKGDTLHTAYANIVRTAREFYSSQPAFTAELSHFSRVLTGTIHLLPERDIRSTVYVVDTLEASIWCLLNTSSYRDAVLKAVNLGEDTDTTGAVTGGAAGIYYGLSGIPTEWLKVLVKGEEIADLCERLGKTLCGSYLHNLVHT